MQELANADFSFIKCSEYSINPNNPVFKRDGVIQTQAADYYLALDYSGPLTQASIEWNKFQFSNPLCSVNRYAVTCTDS